MANLPNIISIHNIAEWSSTDDASFQFLRDHQLLSANPSCHRCNSTMSVVADNARTVPFVFRCNQCKTKRSVLTDTFYQDTKLTLSDHIHLAYYWASQTPVTVAETHLNLSNHTIIDHFNFYRDICSWKLLNIPVTLGGIGARVEIDESAMYKAKYHVGHGLHQRTQWVRIFIIFQYLNLSNFQIYT